MSLNQIRKRVASTEQRMFRNKPEGFPNWDLLTEDDKLVLDEAARIMNRYYAEGKVKTVGDRVEMPTTEKEDAIIQKAIKILERIA